MQVLIDFIGLILLLPIYNVWGLQMPIQRKLAVIGIFLLGGLVVVAGGIRLYYLHRAYASIRHWQFDDFTCEHPSASIFKRETHGH